MKGRPQCLTYRGAATYGRKWELRPEAMRWTKGGTKGKKQSGAAQLFPFSSALALLHFVSNEALLFPVSKGSSGIDFKSAIMSMTTWARYLVAVARPTTKRRCYPPPLGYLARAAGSASYTMSPTRILHLPRRALVKRPSGWSCTSTTTSLIVTSETGCSVRS
jgi:hypothetical protein